MDQICAEFPLFWDPKSQFVTSCSIQLFIDVPLHILLLMTCSFALGRLSRSSFSDGDEPQVSLRPRKLICAIQILAIIPLVPCIIVYYFVLAQITPASCISICVQCMSLLILTLNIIQVIRKGREVASSSTTCFLFFTFASSFTYLYSSILSRKTWTDTTVILSSIIICLRALLTTSQFFKSIPVIQPYDEINESLMRSNIELRGEEPSSTWSKWTFKWVYPLVDRGSRFGSLTFSDLFALPESLSSFHVSNLSSSSDPQSPSNQTSLSNSPSLSYNDTRIWKILLRTFKRELIFAAFLKFIADTSSFFGPVLLNKILTFLETDQNSPEEGLLYAFLLFISVAISSLVNCQFNFILGKTTLRMKSFLIQKIYRKLLKTSTSSDVDDGQIISLISSDCDRIINWCPSVMASFSCPLQLVIAMILLYQQLGETFLAGVGVALIILPSNKWICTKIGQFTSKMMEAKDERLRIMNEILRGIRQIKILGWESIFAQKINTSRGREVKFLKYRKYLDAACVYFWATTPTLVALAAFSCYILTNHQLNSAIVFTSLALFNMMMMPLNAFPWVLNGLVEAWVSMKRLESFLNFREIRKSSLTYNEVSTHIIRTKDAVFQVGSSFRLGPINLDIKRGSFIGIVGRVGSGKSTLLRSILGEVDVESGLLDVTLENPDSGIGYLPQEPWIQNTTIRNNILFGKHYDYVKYQKILDVVTLSTDLGQMSQGDATVIGERGSMLSGGQRTRLALARELYQDYEMYLFDDIFSSLDATTAAQIYDCIKNFLRGKTRVLFVQDPKYLRGCDLIIELESGQISRIGSPEDFLTSDSVDQPENRSPIEIQAESCREPEDEVREVGLVKLSIVSQYLEAAGIFISAFVVLSVVAMQVSRNGSDLWLAHWSSSPNSSQSENLEIYAAIGVTNSLTTLVRAVIFAYAGIAAAIRIHETLFKTVISSTCTFFDTTSSGRTLNRFSSDVWNVDDALPFTLNIFLAQSAGLFASIFLTVYGLPIIAILVLLLIFPYFKLQSFYRWTSRDLKRLTSSNFAPILSLASESVDGRITIRAGNSGSRFIEEMLNKIDISTGCQYSSKAASEWLNLVS